MFKAGDRVVVTATSDFYAFIDGVICTVGELRPDGLISVYTLEEEETLEGFGDIKKVFLVPSEQLQLTV